MMHNWLQVKVLKFWKLTKIIYRFFQKQMLEKFPNVMVDMGAVKFMCKGANVMRQESKFSEFEKDKLVCIIEESQHKFLAVGKPWFKFRIRNNGQRRSLKNLHYISDKFWEIGKLSMIN